MNYSSSNNEQIEKCDEMKRKNKIISSRPESSVGCQDALQKNKQRQTEEKQMFILMENPVLSTGHSERTQNEHDFYSKYH